KYSAVWQLTAKAGLAGGALYLVYSQGLLGSSDKGAHALHKAKAAVPPANLSSWFVFTTVAVSPGSRDSPFATSKSAGVKVLRFNS
uniref:MICOS complex subunit MIC13 n=1 Tax=Pseudonaja textilis TaxID=8673 RepID=A0A670ZJN7_PSETE